MKELSLKINHTGKPDLFAAEHFNDVKNVHLDYPKSRAQEYFVAASFTKKKNPTFQKAMKLTIFIGQCFGLNPVLGIFDDDPSKLRFTFVSGRCFYSILTIVGQSSFLFVICMKLLRESDSLIWDTSVIFIGSNGLTTILFFRIAMRWPRLCQLISRGEATNPNLDSSLVKKCNMSCIVILSLAALEHILSDISGLALAIDCQPDTYLYRAFNLQSFPAIWYFVSYNDVYGAIAQFINIQCTFNWNFADLFVICISIYLTSRFEQIKKRLMAVKGKPDVPSSFWRTMREDYSRTVNLVRRVDDVIGGIIFVSFANNLFFICLQLLHTLEPLHGYEQAVYFVFSFSFLMARSLAVSLAAARIHTVSLEPAQVLYEVPSNAYCVEIQRFLDQIHGDSVALTGLQFFNIKRGLVLTIAGTIVTYELVLMQFAGVTPTATPSSVLPTVAS